MLLGREGQRCLQKGETLERSRPLVCETADRATVRQSKTGQPVRFELSEQTRQAVDDYLKAANKRPGEFFFTSRRGPESRMTTRQYARLVTE